MSGTYAHPNALVESRHIGKGTRIWAFAHVMAGASIGENCNIGDHCFIEAGAVVGDNVTIKNGVMLWEGVTLGNGVFVGPQVLFTNDLRPRSPRLALSEDRYRNRGWLLPTYVAQGASLGAGAIVLPGIRIGEFAMIAAGAVVTRDVSAHGLIIGNPGRRAGWACFCGHRLALDAETATCPACRQSFLYNGDSVTPQGPAELPLGQIA